MSDNTTSRERDGSDQVDVQPSDQSNDLNTSPFERDSIDQDNYYAVDPNTSQHECISTTSINIPTVIDYASQELELIEEEAGDEEDVRLDDEEESNDSTTAIQFMRYEHPINSSEEYEVIESTDRSSDEGIVFEHDVNVSHTYTNERLKSKCNRYHLRNSRLNLDGGCINARVSLFDKEVNGFRSRDTMGVMSWKDVNPDVDDESDPGVNIETNDDNEVHLNPLELDIRLTRIYSLIDRAQRLVFDKYREDIIADYYKDLMRSDNVVVINSMDIDDVKNWENMSSVYDICNGRIANSIRYIIISVDITDSTKASDLKNITLHCLRQIKLSKSARVIVSFNIRGDADYDEALDISRSFITEQAYNQWQIQSIADAEVAPPSTTMSSTVNQKEYVNQPRVLPPVDVPHYEFENNKDCYLSFNSSLRKHHIPEHGSGATAVEQSGISDSEYSIRQFDLFESIVGGNVTPMFLSVFMHAEFDVVLDNQLQEFSTVWFELKRLKADKDKYVQNGYA